MSEEKHTHVHVLEDGTVIEHSHDHAHGHHHTNTKAVLNRLSRAIGHMESIKRMVEEGRDCTEVLIQMTGSSSPGSRRLMEITFTPFAATAG